MIWKIRKGMLDKDSKLDRQESKRVLLYVW